eukprot:SAG31_NODE_41504_length_275_cov_3.090909_2_plen_53_part_01
MSAVCLMLTAGLKNVYFLCAVDLLEIAAPARARSGPDDGHREGPGAEQWLSRR